MVNLAIKIPFDNTGNPIRPTFVLATKSGRKLGAIPAKNIHISDKFNSYFDLSFKVYKYNNCVKCNRWDDIKDFKFVYVPEWDIWFEIYVEIDESNDMVKNISAKSVGEAELSQINLYDVQINTEEDIARDDYVPTVFYDEDTPEGSLLNRMTEKAPHYKTHSTYIDDSIKKIQRTFTFDKKSIYDSFQKVGEEIDCLFEIDSSTNSEGQIAREYKVHDLESHCTNIKCGHRGNDFTTVCPKCGESAMPGYGEDTTIFVSVNNLADNISYSTDVDSVKNCFKLEAGDDLMTATVINCNPNGSAYIWYIPDELKQDMSQELQDALDAYEKEYELYQSKEINLGNVTSYNNVVNYCDDLKNVDNFEFKDLQKLSSSVDGYPELMTAYYDTVDLKLLLESGLMPSPILSEEEEEEGKDKMEIEVQADKVIEATEDLLDLSISIIGTMVKSALYVTNAIVSFAKSFLDSKFDIEASQVSVDNEADCSIWNGILKIFNRSDQTQCKTLSFGINTSDAYKNISAFNVNDNIGNYSYQKIIKTLNSNNEDVTDIISIFQKDENNFKSELKKYSLKRLESFRDACQACLDVLAEQGTSEDDVSKLYNDYYKKLTVVKEEIKDRESQIAIVDVMQNNIITKRNEIQKDLDFESFITNYSNSKKLWLELAVYRRDDTYSNQNYISDGLNNVELFDKAQEFYNVAQNEIFKSATLQHSITATLKNLLVMKEFKPLIKHFKVGNWIRIEVNEKIYKLRLLSYEIDFDNLDNISVEFSDVKKIRNGVSDVESILSQAASMTTSYGSVSRQASQGQKGNEQLNTWVSDGLALTQMKIINDAKNQNVTWDKGGLLCREYNDITEEYEQEQLKIINTTLAITNDNWESVKTAIGKFYYIHPVTNKETLAFGVNAEAVVGKLLIGQELGLYNPANTLTFDENGLVVKDKASSPTRTITIKPSSTDLFKIDTNKGTVFKIDDEGDVVISGKITSKSGNIGGWTVDENLITDNGISKTVGLYSGTNCYYKPITGNNSNTGVVRFFAGGTLKSSDTYPAHDEVELQDGCPFLVDSQGRLKATEGKIGDWVIGKKTLSYGKEGFYSSDDYLINVCDKFLVAPNGKLTATSFLFKGDSNEVKEEEDSSGSGGDGLLSAIGDFIKKLFGLSTGTQNKPTIISEMSFDGGILSINSQTTIPNSQDTYSDSFGFGANTLSARFSTTKDADAKTEFIIVNKSGVTSGLDNSINSGVLALNNGMIMCSHNIVTGVDFEGDKITTRDTTSDAGFIHRRVINGVEYHLRLGMDNDGNLFLERTQVGSTNKFRYTFSTDNMVKTLQTQQ